MSIKKKPNKRGRKPKETKHAFPMDLLWQAVRSSAEGMDYSHTTGGPGGKVTVVMITVTKPIERK